MHIESLSVQQLKPAPYNPRLPLKPGDPGWEKLKRSLDEFDLVQPIIWNRRTGHVVAGHQRLEILKDQGRREVDCVIVDLSLEREKALNVTLNNAAVGSDWEPAKLVDLLGELRELPGVDATLTGFDDQQLRDMLFVPDPDFAPAADAPAERDPEEVLVRLEVPRQDWDDVRSELDELLAAFPQIRLHVAADVA
ncbi:ParB-like nuclease domain protein [Maioricimonas rarisocia]|uniref:ParB-like nuclease domain protein n=1 Tax=Maioricimonas rarisocia TaxID=2528026 RepID=A0A517ZF35_9PLAN|nr:ParB N-terminal domain-containing protein [Maioricimonas rarisocia]QDU41088.1 ParB-like nuclease domain protein [Maioricimonas rarisocia]